MNATEHLPLFGLLPGLLVAGILLTFLPWVNRDTAWRTLPIIVVAIFTARYLIWRATATIPPMHDTLDFLAGSLFYAIELTAVAGAAISYITLSRTSDRSAEVDANTAWLETKPRPALVDVFICTFNEERDILEQTMLGALGIDYPNFRVWVLDDGRRPWLANLAGELGCNYLTRQDNDHAKAGNINNGLRHVLALADPPEFISILDADFVPTPALLSRTLPLFRRDDVGIVQTPQHFINSDPIQTNLRASDAWPDEQRYFFDVLMPAKDAWGTAFCCGTSSVIRVEALTKTGGFPTDSVTEDYLLTLRLKRISYRTVYLNERLSLGLAPEGLREYITQRSRWCLGFMQIVRSADGPFMSNNGLGLADRISLIESFLYWSAAYVFRFAGLVIPILYLLFDVHALNVDTADGISHFLPFYLSQVIVMAWLSGQRVLPILTDLSQLLAAREILTAAAIGLFRPKNQKFNVTAKGGDRSHTVIQWRMMAPFLVLLGLTILGVVVTFYGSAKLQEGSGIALYWAWYNIILLVATILTCIERPRLRKRERMRRARDVTISVGGRTADYVTADVSLCGMRLAGPAPAPIGTRVTVDLGARSFGGWIARGTSQDFAVAMDESIDVRTAMIGEVYAGRAKSNLADIRSALVARKVVARIFG